MVYESQNDLRWSGMKMGSTNLTLGQKGCLVTCISMITDYFKALKTPDKFALCPTLFGTAPLTYGMVQYSRLNLVTSVKLLSKIVGRNDAAIKASLIDPKQAVVLNVNNGAHFILALHWVPIINDYLCLDPWTGKTCFALQKYHNIVGSRHFTA